MPRCFANTRSGFPKLNKGGIFGGTGLTVVQNVIQQTVIGTGTGEVSREYVIELMKYDRLKHLVIDDLEQHVTRLKEGDLTALQDNFDLDEKIEIATKLFDGTLTTFSEYDIQRFINSGTLFNAYQSSQPGFTDFTSFMAIVMDGLTAAITVFDQNLGYANQVNDLAPYRGILEDAEQLKQYIRENYDNFTSNLITVEFQVSTLQIKPEFIEYMNRYGIPPQGQHFDTELLVKLRLEMGIE